MDWMNGPLDPEEAGIDMSEPPECNDARCGDKCDGDECNGECCCHDEPDYEPDVGMAW